MITLVLCFCIFSQQDASAIINGDHHTIFERGGTLGVTILRSDYRGENPRNNGSGTLCTALIIRNGWAVTANHCCNSMENADPTSGNHYPSLIDGKPVAEVHHFWEGPPDTHRPTIENSHLWNFFGDAALLKSERPFVETTQLSEVPPSCYFTALYSGPPDELIGKEVICFGLSGTSTVLGEPIIKSGRFPVLSLWNGWSHAEDYGYVIGEGVNQQGQATQVGYGDSGGPCFLVENGEFYLTGIISDAFGAGDSGVSGHHGVVGINTLREWFAQILPALSEQLPDTPQITSIEPQPLLHGVLDTGGQPSSSNSIGSDLFYRVHYTVSDRPAAYQIRYATVPNSSNPMTRGWYTTDSQVVGLLENQNYYLRIAARNGCGITIGRELKFTARKNAAFPSPWIEILLLILLGGTAVLIIRKRVSLKR